MSDAAHRPGRPVPPDRAAAVVRHVAKAHRARHITRQLGEIRPDRIARARTGFAKGMTDDEVPLVLVDTSFWRNGAAGFLLTNRAVHSSWLPGPVALEDVETVRHRPPDRRGMVALELLVVLGHFFPPALILLLPVLLFRKRDRRTHALHVNDRVIYTGPRNLTWGFWVDVLLALRAVLDDGLGRSRVRVLEVLPADPGEPPLRAYAPPWEAIERSLRALDGTAIRAVRLWAGDPRWSPGLEVIATNGEYALRELATGRGDDEADVERVLAVARLFAATGSFV